MKNIPLNKCFKNITYKVDYVDTTNISISRRLTELGFIEGASIKIIQFSVLKKTLLIEIEGYVLSLRSSIGEMIKVKQ